MSCAAALSLETIESLSGQVAAFSDGDLQNRKPSSGTQQS
jgi:hypothetical protein